MEKQKSVSSKETPKENLQLVQDSQYKQYLDTMARMQQVVSAMRESPAGSPAPPPIDDSSTITHVVFPPEGGILTYLARYEQPFRGFPLNDTVQAIDELKKLAKIIVQNFTPYLKRQSIFSKIRFLLAFSHFRKLGEYYLLAYGWHIKRNRLKPNMYCQPVREIFKVIDGAKDTIESDELREAVRDIFCMFLEFDNAYRYRFQDILMELNRENLKKNPRKEISRLLGLLMEREVGQKDKVNMSEKWKMAENILNIALRIYPCYTKAFKNILLRINLKEIDFSKEDRYYCEFRKDYRFEFMQRENLPIREVPKGNPINIPQASVSKVEKTSEVKQ